jgi:prepilin-type N-terminal cleavage/methylation domain-containing protein
MFREKGFTLIELIITLIIVGTLAVVALPRYLNLSNNSHSAALEGAASQFRQAIAFAHQRWYINGHGAAPLNDMPGYALDANGNPQLDMNDVGYPLGIDKNSPMGAPYNIGKNEKACREIWEAIMDASWTVSDDINDIETVDFYGYRLNFDFTTPEGNTISANSACYYIYTHSGFNQDPDLAEYVMWYNSRNGDVFIGDF